VLVTDLIGLPVREEGGAPLGVVVDCRFLLENRHGATAGESRLYGLLVGRHAGRSFLGYERSQDDSPSLIARYFRWRQRDTALVLWSDVRRIAEDRVEVRRGVTRYDPILA
jgi:hypothetical protein